jgi:glycine C-acetyltransferase
MKDRFYTLKDFELSNEKNAIERANDFQIYINQLNDFGCKSYWIASQTGVGSTMNIEGYNKPVISFIANDYLGMSQREETIQVGIEALKKYGTGACAAQVIGGYLDIHKQLEEAIADFVGQEDSLLFSSGFGANAGVLRALLGKNDIALIDPFIHTSTLAGLHETNIKRIGHNDLEYLEKTLKDIKDKYQTKLVIIDGVYSQDGDISMLPEIISLCKAHDAMLMVDDAHGIGVMGNNGRGTVEHFDCLGQVDIITGTFSKSFGCVGGFVAASKKLIQYLRFYADSNVFSAAPTPQVTASVLKALELIKTKPEIRQKLWNNTNYLRTELTNRGFDIGKSVSPIFPIMVRDNKKVYQIAKLLQERGIFTIAIVYPAVRIKEARLRVSILSTHEKEHLDYLTKSLEEINKIVRFK